MTFHRQDRTFDLSTLNQTTDWPVEDTHNLRSALGYTDYLFSRHARLLAVRVDFSFLQGALAKFQPEHARDYFRRFKNNFRQTWMGNHLLGYLWGLEYGEQAGFHYHCIFFYNEVYTQQDQVLGHALGQYWSEVITGGQGSYYCSNGDKERLAAQGLLGIGKVHRNDPLTRQNLNRVVSYLVKESDATRRMLPESLQRFRTYGRTEV